MNMVAFHLIPLRSSLNIVSLIIDSLLMSHLTNEAGDLVFHSIYTERSPLNMSMNESPHTVCEQNIHFLWLYNRRYFALANRRVHQCLSFAISSRPIIGRTCLNRSSPSCSFLIWNPRPAYWATYARDPSLFSHGSDDVASLFVTRHAHLFDSISG